jgi:hypothetical protein
MSLLQTNKKYSRPQPQPEAPSLHSPNLVGVLENEAYNLLGELSEIEEAKSREHALRLRLNVVQQSLQAFRALEAAPEPVQEKQAPPPPVVKNVRKAATKKSATPTARSIAPEPTVSDTENIELVHDDFATFPE